MWEGIRMKGQNLYSGSLIGHVPMDTPVVKPLKTKLDLSLLDFERHIYIDILTAVFNPPRVRQVLNRPISATARAGLSKQIHGVFIR